MLDFTKEQLLNIGGLSLAFMFISLGLHHLIVAFKYKAPRDD